MVHIALSYASKINFFKKILWNLTFWRLLPVFLSPILNCTLFPFVFIVPVLLNLGCISSSLFSVWGFVLEWNFSWLNLRVHRVLISSDFILQTACTHPNCGAHPFVALTAKLLTYCYITSYSQTSSLKQTLPQSPWISNFRAA